MKPTCVYCGRRPRKEPHVCKEKLAYEKRIAGEKPESPKGIGLGLVIEGGKI